MEKEQSIRVETTIEAIVELLNHHDKWDCGLNELLIDRIDWSNIEPSTIIPRKELRLFTKSIDDKEVRLTVMKFLHDYAEYYFYPSVKKYERTQFTTPPSSSLLENHAQARMHEFQSELATQISQIENLGLYTGDKFSKLQKRVAQLEEEVGKYKRENQELQDKVDRFENPHKYGKFIPAELNNRQFHDIMQYLQSKQIVLPHYTDKDYVHGISSYEWYGTCALFGYFVWKLNQEFDLNEARDQLNWQIFETAINNYEKLIKEARKVVSTFRNDDKTLLPAKADYVEEAIKYANGELK